MKRNLQGWAGLVVLGVVLVGCTAAAEPEAGVGAASGAPSTAAPSVTPTPTPPATAEPSDTASPPPAASAPPEPAPAPAPPPPPPPAEPAEEVLSREEAEAVLIDTIAEELGIPRFIVSRYIAANGGLDAVARENGVSEEDIAQLNAGVTRSELDEALGPLVGQIEQRLSEG